MVQNFFSTLYQQLRKVEPLNWLVIIFLLGVVMRLPLLDGSLWLDEAAQALESSRPLSEQLNIRDDFQPPLIHLVVHGLLQFSNLEVWLRFGAAFIPGVVTIMVLVQIGRRYFSPATGWISGLLLATSSFHIFYSQELRPYSLPAMFVCLSWWAVLEMTRQKKISRDIPTEIFRFSIWSICGLYSSYLYPFALFGQALYLLWSWRKSLAHLKQLAGSCSVICLAYLPWIPSFLGQVLAGQQLRQNFPGWEDVVSFDQIKSIGLIGGKFLFGVLDLSAHPFYLVTTVTVIILTGILVSLNRQQVFVQKTLPVVLCWLVIPLLTGWIISFWIPVIQPKRVLFALPALYLMWSSLSVSSFRQPNRSWKVASLTLLGILFLVNVIGSFAYYTNPKYQRENWREIQKHIDQKYRQAKSIVVFGFPDQFASWAWYNTSQFPTTATGVFVLSEDPSSPERQQLKQLADYQYVLVFDYLRDLSDPHRLIEQDLERFGFQQVDVIQGNEPLGNIKVYAKTRQIIGYSEYWQFNYADWHWHHFYHLRPRRVAVHQ